MKADMRGGANKRERIGGEGESLEVMPRGCFDPTSSHGRVYLPIVETERIHTYFLKFQSLQQREHRTDSH
jgi:hypothetical protein